MNASPPLAKAEKVSKRDFAAAVGLTPGRISQLIKAGLPVEPNGRIDLAAGQGWIAENVSPVRRMKRDGVDPDFAESRAQREAAEARIAELKADRLAGQLIPLDATQRMIESRARMERDALLAWINRAAVEVANETGADLQAVTAILDREARAHLNVMAETALELPE